MQQGLPELRSLLQGPRIDSLRGLIAEIEGWQLNNKTIPVPKTFLSHAKLHPLFQKMLENIIKYRAYLELFITHFNAANEGIAPHQNTPLHYAAEAVNVDFMKWLLIQSNLEPDVNSRNKQRQTALFLLCEQYDIRVNNSKFKKRALSVVKAYDINTEDVCQCILLLLDHGASFNICNDYLQLPFELLIRNTSRENQNPFIEECRSRFASGIAISEVHGGGARVVGFYQDSPPVTVTVELLEIYLRFGEKEKFSAEMAHFNVNASNVKTVIKLLLHIAVELDLEFYVRKILDRANRIIFQVERKYNRTEAEDDSKSLELRLTHRLELKGLLKKACQAGNVRTLRLLLNQITDSELINDDPILVITLNQADECYNRTEERSRLLQCAEFLSKERKIFVSSTDNNGNTALHNAMRFGFHHIALELIKKKHIYLGVRNKDGLTPLSCARYGFWKQYFDQCISIDKKRSNFDRNEIRFNLHGFNPYILKKRKVSPSKDEAEPTNRSPTESVIVRKAMALDFFQTEIDPVKIIAKSEDLKRLLLHPVVYTFIQIKWLSMTKWSYINLVCTLATVSFFSWNSIDVCDGDDGASMMPTVLSLIGAIYLICREAIQFMFLRQKYFYSLENYMDAAIVITMLWVLFRGCNSILSSLTVIAFAMQLTIIIGSLPFGKFSTYMYMLKTVSINFVISFVFFMPLLSAFALSFFMVYNDRTMEATEREPENNAFNQFSTFSSAALKTLVMTTGEFEAAEVDFSGGKIVLFVLFVFFAPIVILNLINGLAVSDITAIMQKSELISISRKVFILDRYERGLRNIPFESIRRFFSIPFFDKHSYLVVVKRNESQKVLVEDINKIPTVQPEPEMIPVQQTDNSPANDQQNPRGRKADPKANWKVVPKIPGAWFVRGSEGCTVNLMLLKFHLFLTLENQIVDLARQIAEQSIIMKETHHSGRLEGSYADTVQHRTTLQSSPSENLIAIHWRN
ncbi:transient receptor potential cation channel protein painless-like [Malaya genurostris]|uniref:transient receptor potential cation channel protein painless-like n=1 Tax=Malaya genurostris TaxID=325434 RepID=UPI0026F3E41F|nr:transient receptor potential cation channel protein painless-like [Malaya genurostris]